ncbi:MAG: preprotein translocase subunit SecG [Gloeomargarita sp. SKYG116]|nr:preprotein translocase subunit SecG [Gloeomargarita sp. SKYG116]MDW8401275.1 preprotein translocase subunit SecG [Gloeomargarita sp. SKYGB_i_bin116]
MSIVTLVEAIWLFSAVALVILILLHSPKGEGIAAIGGQAQLFSSTRSAETTLNRVTWSLAVVFMSATVVLSAGWLPGSNVNPPKPAEVTPPSQVNPIPPELPAGAPEPTPVTP